MATRFDLTSAAPPYTPATRRGTWNIATGEDIQLLGRKPTGSAGTSAIAVGSTAAGRTTLLHRSISAGAVKAGTLSGTVTWTIGVKESNVDANASWRLHVYVTSGDSDTPRGTLLSNYSGSTEFTTTATGASDGPQTVTPVAVQLGDRLVVEIGYLTSATGSLSTAYSSTINYGNVGTTDLATGDTAVTAEPGWVEFSGADGLFTPSFNGLVELFPSIDGKWIASAGTTGVGGRARITCGTTLASLYTATAYEIQGATLAFQVPTVPVVGGGTGVSFSAYLSAGPTVSNTNLEISYSPNSGNLVFRNNVGGVDGSPTTVVYSAASHQWWRWREAAGSIYMETSPDNVTWTTQRTIGTMAQWMRLGNLIFYAESVRTSGTPDYAEIDNINPVTAQILALTNAAEIDTAQPLGRTKARAVTNAASIETAQALGRTKSRAIAPAGSVDTAQSLGRTKTRATVNGASVEAAQVLGRTKTRAIAPAVTIETAQPLGRAKSRPLGPAYTVETAQAFAATKRTALGTAIEVDTAQAMGRTKTAILGPAVSVETAQAPGRAKSRPLTPAQAIETVQVLGRSKHRPLTPAGETSTVQQLVGRKVRLLLPAFEVDAARVLAAPAPVVPVRDITLTVQPLPGRWSVHLGPARWTATERTGRWHAHSD